MNTFPLFFKGLADADLEWARQTGFRHFHKLRSSDAVADRIALLFALRPEMRIRTPTGNEASQRVALLRAVLDGPPEGAEAGYEFRSASVPIKLLEQLGQQDLLKAIFTKIELASPVAASRIDESFPGLPPLNTGDLLLGIIDDGCPFARPEFVSRVHRLWDQNPVQPIAEDPDSYGRRWVAKELSTAIETFPHDDIAAYEFLRLLNMRRRATHGAHVMDVFAGPVPVSSRVSPSRLRSEHAHADGSSSEAPIWDQADDPASRAPIVFVQPPETAVDDPTGRWLGRQVLDGLDYIIDQAGKAIPRIVVNISWGPQTGPRDGSSLLEKAFAERLESESRLSIVLPAGNSFEARAHAQFELKSGCKSLAWHVPPGGDTPSFLEVWWPDGTDMGEVGITVTSPCGEKLAFVQKQEEGGIVSTQDNSWGITVVPHGERIMALLALAPGFSHGNEATSASGTWLIDVDHAGHSHVADKQVHIYVARSNANMGGKRRTRDSYLFDADYDPDRHVRPSRSDNDASIVKREGTLNGIAGPNTPGSGPLVAAGYVLSREVTIAAPYSSSGPQSESPPGRRPDWALPTDESHFLPGLLAGGVRSGSAIRLVGTSTAAPQLARKIANGEVNEPPPPDPPNEGERPPAPPAPDPRLGRGTLPI